MKEEINIEEIKKLEKVRRELLEKIKKLKAKEGETKPHIFKRVFSEYQEKLNKIQMELDKRKDGIKKYVDSFKMRKRELVKNKLKIEDEIEELKLRFSIGEFDEAVYKSMLEEKKSGLKNILEKIKLVEKEIMEMENLLGGLEVSVSEEKKLEKVEETPEIEIEEMEEAIEIEEGIQEVEEIDELEEIQEESVSKGGDVEDELKEIEELLEEVASTEEKREEESEEVSVNEKLLENLGKESRTEERGEVVCKKCGHKNSPDAWFCENCGAELIIELE